MLADVKEPHLLLRGEMYLPCLDAALLFLGLILNDTEPLELPFFARFPDRLAVAPGCAKVSANSPSNLSEISDRLWKAFTCRNCGLCAAREAQSTGRISRSQD